MEDSARFDLNFGRSGDRLFLGQGWSTEEHDSWAVGSMSSMTFPIPEGHGDAILTLTVHPVVVPPMLRSQRLRISVGDWLVAAFVLTEPRQIEVRIPPLVFEDLDKIDLRLDHPDAARPSDLIGVNDDRRLAIRFSTGTLRREAGTPPALPHPPATPAAIPRTLVFCTSYASSDAMWNARYGTWLTALLRGMLRYDQILMIDDGSPVRPKWQGLEVVADAPDARANARAALYRFENNLGVSEKGGFPGWFRSFGFAGTYAARMGFDKIVHIESDAFLITPAIQRYFNARRSGWTALWCPLHELPESGIQIMAGREINDYRAFMAQPYEALRSNLIERLMPFTRVEKQFAGDRYGEMGDVIPRGADFAMQTRLNRYTDPDYLWWLK